MRLSDSERSHAVLCCLPVSAGQITVPLILSLSLRNVEMETLEQTTRDYVARISRSAIHDDEPTDLAHNEQEEEDEEELQIIHPHNADSVLLKCHQQQPLTDSIQSSVWGFRQTDTKGCTIDMYQPQIQFVDNDCTNSVLPKCVCTHPRGQWSRTHLASALTSSVKNTSQNTTCRMSDLNGVEHQQSSIRMIDLASLQLKRRRINSYHAHTDTKCSPSNISINSLRMNTPAAVLHLLRSSLSFLESDSLHVTSPWKGAYTNSTTPPEPEASPTTICVVLLYPSSFVQDESESWHTLEKDELKSFVEFRTGDAIPSYSLYSVSRILTSHQATTTLSFWKQFITTLQHMDGLAANHTDLPIPVCHNGQGETDSLELAFLIYKPIPHRLHMLLSNPESLTMEQKQPTLDFCSWEKISHTKLSLDDDDKDTDKPSSRIHPSTTTPMASTTDAYSYRRVAPPYQDYSDLYPFAFDVILENLEKIRKEAQSIPLWTAWPERNHYESSTSKATNDDTDTTTNNTTTGASWTVFPLCHTFPATDVSSRKWISKTCQFVPFTVSLLKDDPILSPLVRTALFSRLEPRTMLSPHTGWADLANFVLRVHIPLVVPAGGRCGLWVDGCVETHDEGRIVCFDDSKVHRAFNYSDEDRIVLIVDLVRPTPEIPSVAEANTFGSNYPSFPLGTSVGGHTNELDAFIRQFE